MSARPQPPGIGEETTNPAEMREALRSSYYLPVYDFGEIIFVDTGEVDRAVFDTKYGATGNALLCDNPAYLPSHPFKGIYEFEIDPLSGAKMQLLYPKFALEYGRGKYGMEFAFAIRDGVDQDTLATDIDYIGWGFGNIFDAETQSWSREAKVRWDLVNRRLIYVDRDGKNHTFTEPEAQDIFPRDGKIYYAGLVMDFTDMTFVEARLNQWTFTSFDGEPIWESKTTPTIPQVVTDFRLEMGFQSRSDVNRVRALFGRVIASRVT